jgi:hypothetical protein
MQALERRVESLVNFGWVTGNELIGFVGHADHDLKLLEQGAGHTLAEGGSRVRGDAIGTIVGDADGDVEQFFGERMERARSHGLFQTFPSAVEQSRIVRDDLPEVVDPVDLARGHDVIVNGAHFRACVLVFDQSECGHESLQTISVILSFKTVAGSSGEWIVGLHRMRDGLGLTG